MQDEKLAEIPSNSGSFRLIRLILIDSYSRNRTVEINLDGHISLGRAATLLQQSRFELQARFNRLGLPLRLGPVTTAEGQAEYDALTGPA